MSHYTQILYQLVFGTKFRRKTLTENNREELYNYIGGVLLNKKCQVLQVGGVEDHVHILTHIHPTVNVSTLIKDIKLASTDFIKRKKLFPDFTGWQEGYGAFTYSVREREIITNYIKNQKEHHKIVGFKEEFIKMLHENEVVFEEKYIL